MKESLHPTILFHFTKRKKTLYSILSETFKVSYAREAIHGTETKRELGVPMVSFCDVKLHDIKSHIKNYGSYGIGLTKEWANRNGLNPVLYINKQCELIGNLMLALNNLYVRLDQISDTERADNMIGHYNNLLNLYRYIKNYEGPLKRRGKLVSNNYRFADEKEWRYVPPLKSRDVFPFLPIAEIDTRSKKATRNKAIEHHRLRFEPDDIRYLIVKDDNDIVDLLHHLRTVKSRFDESIIQRLSTRIFTTYQINHDI